MEYTSFVKSSFANLYIADSGSLLSVGDGVEDGSSSSEFGEEGGVGDYESFFEAIDQFGWEHITVRYDEP
jgi:hypothetical protein